MRDLDKALADIFAIRSQLAAGTRKAAAPFASSVGNGVFLCSESRKVPIGSRGSARAGSRLLAQLSKYRQPMGRSHPVLLFAPTRSQRCRRNSCKRATFRDPGTKIQPTGRRGTRPSGGAILRALRGRRKSTSGA